MSLDEILSDVEWEPTIVDLLTPAVSLFVGDPEKELEREDPAESVPDVEPEREKTPISSDLGARDLPLLDGLRGSRSRGRSPGLRR